MYKPLLKNGMMSRFPLFLQPDAMDCGPACLKMVARYFGRNIALQTLRNLSYAGREGTSFLTLIDAATAIGLKATGARLTVESLATAPLPAILHWDQNHFIVLYGIQNKKYRIADPASGLVTLREEELLKHWASTALDGKPAGLALFLEPTPQFYQQEDEPEKRQGFGFLKPMLRPYRGLVVQLILGFLIGSFISLLLPFLTQAIVDKGINLKKPGFITLVLVAQLVLMISQTAVGFLRSWIMLHISARVSISLISGFLAKMMKLPLRFFESRMIGDIRQRIDDNNRIQAFLTFNLAGMSFGVFLFLIYSAVLFWYSLPVALIFLAGSGLYVTWIFLFLRKRRLLDNKRFNIQADNQNAIYQLITGMPDIRLNNCEQQKRWEWEKIQVRLYDISARALALHQNQQGGAQFINQAKNILIIFVAANAVLSGEMTLGMLIAVQFIIGQLSAPLQEFISFVTAAQDARMSLDRLSEIQELENEEKDTLPPENRVPVKKEFVLENVVFQYEGPRSPRVLDDVSLSIPEHKVTALVGPSGSGKTTLVKLLLGFFPPSSGEIKLGGRSHRDVSMAAWRRECGAVMQNGFIFSDSVAGNIAPGEENPDPEKLREAAILANIDDFIERLPLKYNTKIGQEGAGLSQGQRQRILIARAVYKNPSFVILDEATNALDAGNEKTILENLNRFFRNRTVVVVAHRLSTVKNADQIIVLKD
ncbi:MAG TPA: peptidase domain-containing ABC transporter, partial [Prolixibacteraceae bacterium]|nr:peptidase domain-containing ABC transporter [Prolixibacteraceae bacterium]